MNGTRSIFTEAFIRRVAKGWVTNLQEMEEEGKRLFGINYFALRYEDLLQRPFEELTSLWEFLGVKEIDKSLEKQIKAEMDSNPDEEWQAKRNEGIASFLPRKINPCSRKLQARCWSSGNMKTTQTGR
jgi:hypothetical protein